MLLGTCDDLSIARPLGPFSDFLGNVSAPLEAAILGGAPPQALHPLLIAELSPRARPTVLVLEDLHWADEATLDAVTFLARRVGALNAMLILTLRSGEVAPEHPLYSSLGDVAAANPTFVELSPLSADAVAVLAGENARPTSSPRRAATRSTSPSCSRPLLPTRSPRPLRTRWWGGRPGSTSGRDGSSS